MAKELENLNSKIEKEEITNIGGGGNFLDINKLYKICKDRGYKGSKEDLIKIVKMEEKDLMSVCGGTKGINSRRITAGILTLLGLTSSYPVDKVGAEETSRFKTVKNFVKEHPIATGIEGIGLAGTTAGVATATVLAAKKWLLRGNKKLTDDVVDGLKYMIEDISSFMSGKRTDYKNLADDLLRHIRIFKNCRMAYSFFIHVGGGKLINRVNKIKNRDKVYITDKEKLLKNVLEICNRTIQQCRNKFSPEYCSLTSTAMKCAYYTAIAFHKEFKNVGILTIEENYFYDNTSVFFEYSKFEEVAERIMKTITDEEKLKEINLPNIHYRFCTCRNEERLHELEAKVKKLRKEHLKKIPLEDEKNE